MSDINKPGIVLKRDVEAVQIPSGTKITMHAGNSVVITQSLGGSYTVVLPQQAGLFRISGLDADALGKKRLSSSDSLSEEENEDAVLDQLKTCFDPEIPINIVDLGLVYEIRLSCEEDGKSKVHVSMTLTAPGCGMGPTIAEDAKQKILALSWVSDAAVNIVWDPIWSPSMISEAGREKLGMNEE